MFYYWRGQYLKHFLSPVRELLYVGLKYVILYFGANAQLVELSDGDGVVSLYQSA